MDTTDKKIFSPGSYIFLEGDEENSSIYLVESGMVELQCSNQYIRKHLKPVGPGDFLGHVSSMADRPRMTSAVATAETAVVQFRRESFLKLLQNTPHISLKVLDNFSNLLRLTNDLMMSAGRSSFLFRGSSEIELFSLARAHAKGDDPDLGHYAATRYLEFYPEGKYARKAEKIRNATASLVSCPAEPRKEGMNRAYQDRQVIFCENEPAHHLFVIREGKVKIIKRRENHEMILAILKAGDIFGEMAVISDKPRNATAISFGPSTLFPIDRESLEKLINSSPDIIKRIFLSLSQRIWFTFTRVESMLYRKPLTKIISFLENKLLEERISLKSERSHKLSFGIEELLEMMEISRDQLGDSLDTLMNIDELEFHFGQITILNPRLFSNLATLHKERDSLAENIPITRGESKKDACDDDSTLSPGQTLEGKFSGRGKRRETGKTAGSIASVSGRASKNRQVKDYKKAVVEVKGLIHKLETGNKRVMQGVLTQLGNYGETAREALPQLLRIMSDDNRNIRRSVVKTICKILPTEEAAEFFRTTAEDGNEMVRSAAMTGLGELNVAGGKAVLPLILEGFRDSSVNVRWSAARSAGWFGRQGKNAVPGLMELLADRDAGVRQTAAASLGKIAPGGAAGERVREALETISRKDRDRHVKAAARTALSQLKKAASK